MRTELPAGTILRFPEGPAFELLGVIGGGGQAVIYEAREMGTQLYAAIKEVYPSRGFVRERGEIRPVAGPGGAESFDRLRRSVEERETLLGQQAGRKNYQVLHTRGVCHRAELRLPGEDKSTEVCNTYARMDSLREKGMTLGAYIRRCREDGGMTADTALAVMRTVLDAYAALHEDGFLHGDCQTGNLLLLKAGAAEGPGTACIIDFGSVRRLADNGATEEIRDEIYSTDGFCPPELLTRGREAIRLTAACDVWALGVLLLEMLTGRVLQGEEITRFLMTHPREKRLFPDEAAWLHLSPAVCDLLNGILKRALDNDPAARYPNAGAMREDLRRLERCRKLDVSAGVDRHLLWEGSCCFAARNASLFRTEHVPALVERLPVKKLTVHASLKGEGSFPAAELLRSIALDEPMRKENTPKKDESFSGDDLSWMEDLFLEDLLRPSFRTTALGNTASLSRNRNVYLHAPGGAGKSYAAAELFNEFLKTGRQVPLYLDLARFTAETVSAADTPAGAVACLLAEQLFDGEKSVAEELERLFSGESGAPAYCLVLDNLHKVDKAVSPLVLEAVNHISRHWKAVWLLTAGRAEDPTRTETGDTGEFHPAHRVALQFLPKKDMRKLTETVFAESVQKLPEDDLYREFGSTALWGGHEMLEKNRDTLGLPLFFMRYLELLAKDPREIELPNGTAELLAVYFGQREYDANGRSIHDFLQRHMPWVAYRYLRTGQPVHTREEIAGWLEESYGRMRYRPEHAAAFFHDAVENLAVLTPAGKDGLRFVHDCYQEYFSAAAIAGCVRQALDEGDLRFLRKINHLWPENTGEIWLNLCAGEMEKGRFCRICPPDAVLERLYAALTDEQESARKDASHFPGNVLNTCHFGRALAWNEAKQWLGPDPYFAAPCSPRDLSGYWGRPEDRICWDRILPWLRLGAEFGDPQLQYYYGKACWLGIRGQLNRNTDAALDWFCKAGEQEHSEAQDMVAMMYDTGSGVPEDHSTAAAWYRRAAENGHPGAQAWLAAAYASGDGVEPSVEEAERWLRQLTEQNGFAAKTANIFRRGAEKGHADAQYMLGQAYLQGNGVEKNTERGFYWLHEAGRNGNGDAMLLLGMLYEQYVDTERGRAEARKWYEAAAKCAAHPEAAYRLAELCAKGMGTRTCSGVELAVYWYGLAAAGGHPDAEARINAILASNPQLADYLQARPWRVEECCCPKTPDCHWIRRG